MILGDYGADVIKVEKPGSSSSVVSSMRFHRMVSGQGDDTRTWGPPYVEDQSAYFLSINRNKRSIAVDMSREQGQAIIREVRLN
jgi:succinate---hydroxymethylglutarate CoA-transferase